MPPWTLYNLNPQSLKRHCATLLVGSVIVKIHGSGSRSVRIVKLLPLKYRRKSRTAQRIARHTLRNVTNFCSSSLSLQDSIRQSGYSRLFLFSNIQIQFACRRRRYLIGTDLNILVAANIVCFSDSFVTTQPRYSSSHPVS